MPDTPVILNSLLAHSGIGPVEVLAYFAVTLYRPISIAALAQMMGVTRATAAKACRNLTRLGWMRLDGPAWQLQPVPLITHQCQQILADRLQLEYSMAPNRGEFLMKRYLDLLIVGMPFVDNARPDFLANPTTDWSLEYDRLYPHPTAVAFEFNGPQHYTVTKAFPSEEQLKKTQTHDLIKKALSTSAGVTLIVTTAADLEIESMKRLIPADLCNSHVDQDGPYFKTLVRLSANHRAWAQKQKTTSQG